MGRDLLRQISRGFGAVLLAAAIAACGATGGASGDGDSVVQDDSQPFSGSVIVTNSEWSVGLLQAALVEDTNLSEFNALRRLVDLEGRRATAPQAQQRYEELMDLASGAECSYRGLGDGYSDIQSGSQVQIRDQSGTLTATSNLGSGKVVVVDDRLGCSFDFAVAEVPLDVEFLEVFVGGAQRGSVAFSRQDLEASEWNVTLSLGG